MARERARRRRCVSCRNNCISWACHLYADDFGGYFPPDLGTLYPNFVSDGKVFLCLSAGEATPLEIDPCFSDSGRFSQGKYTPAMFGDTHTDYVYVSGLKVTDPREYVLAFDDEWNHDGDGVTVLTVGLRYHRHCWTPDIKAVHEQLARQEKELAAQGRKMKLLRPVWSRYPELPPPRLWYFRRAGRAVAVGVIAAVALALPLIIRTVRRRRKRI
jgi:hypothetical protein